VISAEEVTVDGQLIVNILQRLGRRIERAETIFPIPTQEIDTAALIKTRGIGRTPLRPIHLIQHEFARTRVGSNRDCFDNWKLCFEMTFEVKI
jgi:hypothetical protein